MLAGRACGCLMREFGGQVPVPPYTTAIGFEPSVGVYWHNQTSAA